MVLFARLTTGWGAGAEGVGGHRGGDGQILPRRKLRSQRLDLIRDPFQIRLIRTDVAIELCNFINCLPLPGRNSRESFPLFR